MEDNIASHSNDCFGISFYLIKIYLHMESFRTHGKLCRAPNVCRKESTLIDFYEMLKIARLNVQHSTLNLILI